MNKFFQPFAQLIVCSIFLAAAGCGVETTNEFWDTREVEQLLADHEREIKSRSRDMQIGVEKGNGKNSATLKFTFDKVKFNLMDAILLHSSKELITSIYQQVEDKDRFDKYAVVYQVDPNFEAESDEDFSFAVKQIDYSFSKEDLN